MRNSKLKNIIASLFISSSILFPIGTASASATDDIDAEIRAQQETLQNLYNKKKDAKDSELSQRIYDLEMALSKVPHYDSEGAITSLAAQINELRARLEAQESVNQQILETLNTLKNGMATAAVQNNNEVAVQRRSGASRFLVNPGNGGNGSGEDVSYTQDAINSQGNSTMTFAYSPEQLYKIYCRRGYLTDLTFKKGEEITYVGGGDTAGWAVSTTTVDGTPHLYIKPVVEASTTNLIVTTTKHSYQLILNTSDWYNPMVRWVYDAEEQAGMLLQKQKDERITTGNLKINNVDQLDFNYKVKGGNESNRPIMVFSDGTQTFVKFRNLPPRQAPLFIRERGKRELALVNYRIKDNYYIIEREFDIAQFRISDSETMTIKHGKGGGYSDED